MKFDLFQAENGDWRWRVKSPNGKVVGESGEGYKEAKDAVRGFVKCWQTSLGDIKAGCEASGYSYDLVKNSLTRIKQPS